MVQFDSKFNKKLLINNYFIRETKEKDKICGKAESTKN